MANSLNLEQLDDFVEATLNRMDRKEWVDISMPLQHYTFARRWFKSKKKPEKGGTRLEWKLRIKNQGTFKHSGLFAVDSTNRVNVLANGVQGWSKQTVNYIYDLDEEAFQSGPEKIIDLMEVNEQGLYNDFFEGMETCTWTAPSSSTLNPMPPSGIPFWLQKSATTGFNGGDPSGFASGAGDILTSLYARWKNYTFGYQQVNRTDLIEKVINAMDFCYFEAPQPYPNLVNEEPNWGIYGVHATLAILRRLLQAGNDNLKGDVAAWSNSVAIRGVPFTWVPALTNTESDAYDSTNPIYGVNWETMEYFFKEGRNMIKHPPIRAARQHNVRERHMDNWGNFVCRDRRRNFVGYDTTA